MERCARGSPGMLSDPGIFLAKPLPWIICKKVIIWIKYKRTEFTGALTNKNNLLHFWKHLRLVLSSHQGLQGLTGLMVFAGEPIDKNHNQKNNSSFLSHKIFNIFFVNLHGLEGFLGQPGIWRKMMMLMELLFLRK